MSYNIVKDVLTSQMYRTALNYVASGLSVIPIRLDGSKAPKINSWKPFQENLPSSEEIKQFFDQEAGIGIIAGKISGNLEVLDFDKPGIFEKWANLVREYNPELLSKLPQYETPSGGAHVCLRCSIIGHNQKLALDMAGEVLIETRGEGGYIVAAPSPASCHPAHREYVHIGGPVLPNVPTISPQEREILFECARSFNQKPKRIENGDYKSEPLKNGELRPGDDFNQRTSWEEILQPSGWKIEKISGSTKYWRRPGKTDPGCSATTGYCGDLLYIFSSNAGPFEADKGYSKFAAFALLNHNGDFKAAAIDLAKQGFGKKIPNNKAEWDEIKPLQRSIVGPTPFL
ncbi:MAG: bifunctional DNA primase/polymerase [Deltaproteobacteria bacterium]|nr:MAG: bifunctional DNA primase/polymerase [Deltaproteobacteria bacterium]